MFTVDALFLSTSSLINWWCLLLITTLSNIFTADWLYRFRRFQCVCIRQFIFHSDSKSLFHTRSVYFSLLLLIIRSIYFFIHPIQCLCWNVSIPTQPVQPFPMFLCLWIGCIAVCVCFCWGAYVSEHQLQLWFILYVCVWVCAHMCVCLTRHRSHP